MIELDPTWLKAIAETAKALATLLRELRRWCDLPKQKGHMQRLVARRLRCRSAYMPQFRTSPNSPATLPSEDDHDLSHSLRSSRRPRHQRRLSRPPRE
jgi:hypothetical protein